MYKKITVIAVLVVVLALVVTPVGAITYGQPDGDGHPNVGLTLTDLGGDALWLGCSGTLIAPNVFLTAGHCTHFFAQLGITKTWVTFDSIYTPGESDLIPIVASITHPEYDHNTGFNDVGVVILAEPVPNAALGMLPPESLLDQMKGDGTLKDQTFVNVGYGATANFKGGPPAQPRDGMRRFSLSPYSGLTPNWLLLLGNNDATGQGSICFGDSGGPHFLGTSNIILSVTSLADAVCRTLDMSQRVDTPSVLGFLRPYVTP